MRWTNERGMYRRHLIVKVIILAVFPNSTRTTALCGYDNLRRTYDVEIRDSWKDSDSRIPMTQIIYGYFQLKLHAILMLLA